MQDAPGQVFALIQPHCEYVCVCVCVGVCSRHFDLS